MLSRASSTGCAIHEVELIKTAKGVGRTLPLTLRARADEVSKEPKEGPRADELIGGAAVAWPLTIRIAPAERLRRIANRDGPFRSFDAASHRASASRTFQ
jgi:hypothetical protein